MQAVHIIPLLLDNLDNRVISGAEIVRDVLLFAHLTHLRRQTGTARTWDMLQSWTQIGFKMLVGPNIDSPKMPYT